MGALLLIGGCGDKAQTPATTQDAPAARHAPPEGRAMSPGAVSRVITERGFRPSSVRRRGSTYVVDAVGKSGNQVRLIVDGKAGQIKGMDVIRWAPGAKRIAKGSRGDGFVNDAYEFGVTVPDSYLANWVVYQPDQWVWVSPWIDYGDDYEIDYSDISYDDVPELTYAEWEAAYGAIEAWDDSFYDEAIWETAVETYYEDNADAFEAEYGYAYNDQVFQEDYYEAMEEEQNLAEQRQMDEAEYQAQAEAERDVADQEAYDEAAWQQQAEAERDVADQEAAEEADYQQQAEAERDSGYEEDSDGDY